MEPYQEGLVELKQAGELFEQLVDTVQPLQEDGALLAHIIRVLLVAAAIPELVTVVQPVDLDKHLKPLERTSHSALQEVLPTPDLSRVLTLAARPLEGLPVPLP